MERLNTGGVKASETGAELLPILQYDGGSEEMVCPVCGYSELAGALDCDVSVCYCPKCSAPGANAPGGE